METNENEGVLDLLNKITKDNCHPSDDESKKLMWVKQDLEDFVKHWDEGVKETHSPFYYINTLNKMAKENIVYDNVDLAKLSMLLKKIHGRRYGFEACVLDKDSQGQFVTLCNTSEGKQQRPIEPSLSAYLDAFVDKVFEYYKALKNYMPLDCKK